MLQRQEGGDMADLRTSRDQGDGNKGRHHKDGWRCGWKGDGAENTGTLTTLTILHIITLKPQPKPTRHVAAGNQVGFISSLSKGEPTVRNHSISNWEVRKGHQ